MHAACSDTVVALDEWPVSDAVAGGFGAPILRREDPRMLTGNGRYVADLSDGDCLSMIFVRSPVARAAIRELNVDGARSRPGVAGIYTGRDVDGLLRPRVNAVLGGVEAPDMPILAPGDIRAVGQPIVAIVAETEATAHAAADRVEMELDPLDPICDPETALDSAVLFPGISSNVVAAEHWRNGDPDVAFAAAAVTAEVTVRHPRVAPGSLECRASLAQWDGEAQRLTVWTGTQTPHRARDDIARALGLDPDRVRTVAPDVGGAFGMKASIYPEDIVVAFAAWKLRRSVRWIASRQEDFVAASHGRGAVTRGRMAFDASGRILALKADLIFPLGAWLTFSAMVPAWNAGRILPGPYAIEDFDVHARAVVTNTAPVGIYRGAGRPEAAMLLERLVDAGARELGLDPVAVRQRNLVSAERMPCARPNGTTLDSGDYRALLARTLVAGRLRPSSQRTAPAPRGRRAGGAGLVSLRRALRPGVGECVDHPRRGRTIHRRHRFQHSGAGPGDRLCADCRPGARGRLRHRDDRARGHRVHAERVGALASRSVAIGRERLAEGGPGTDRQGASARRPSPERRAVFAGPDRRRPRRRGESGPVRRVGRDRRDRPRGDSVRGQSTPRAAKRGDAAAASRRCRSTGRPERSGWSGSTMSTTQERWSIRFSSTASSPAGIAQGIGEALLERVVYDPDGQVLTGSFMDYALPRADDMPLLRLDRMCTPSTVQHPWRQGGGRGRRHRCTAGHRQRGAGCPGSARCPGHRHAADAGTRVAGNPRRRSTRTTGGMHAMSYRRDEAREHALANLRGIWAAALQPFKSDLSLDEEGMRSNIRHWVEDLGIDGVFIAGKQGEYFSMTVEERKRVFQIAPTRCAARAPAPSCRAPTRTWTRSSTSPATPRRWAPTTLSCTRRSCTS